jgi:hypothetical protein
MTERNRVIDRQRTRQPERPAKATHDRF